VWVEKVDHKHFYGFVSVEVKSRPSMVGEKKPLHGLMVVTTCSTLGDLQIFRRRRRANRKY
jgi:hypothetical protein